VPRALAAGRHETRAKIAFAIAGIGVQEEPWREMGGAKPRTPFAIAGIGVEEEPWRRIGSAKPDSLRHASNQGTSKSFRDGGGKGGDGER
jgi:hypothetical protein